MLGVAATRSSTSLEEQLLDHRAAGRWTESLSCYEQALRTHAGNLEYQCGLLECQMKLGHMETAFITATGLAAQHPEWQEIVNDYRLEAAWKLGKWDVIDNAEESAAVLFAMPSLDASLATLTASMAAAAGAASILELGQFSSSSFQAQLAHLLQAARRGDEQAFAEALGLARDNVVQPLMTLSPMASDSYAEAYPQILKLQMLQDCEELVKTLVLSPARPYLAREVLKEVQDKWKLSYNRVKHAFDEREALLSIRRGLLDLIGTRFLPFQDEADDVRKLLRDMQSVCWLQTARAARESKLLDTSYTALLRIQSDDATIQAELAVETAKLQWERGEQHEALISLQKFLEKHFSTASQTGSDTQQELINDAQLLVGRWMTETSRFTSDQVLRHYQALISRADSWDQAYYALGKYSDGLLQVGEISEQQLPQIVRHYGLSLVHGCMYTFQALPRLLTLWLEYGSRFVTTTEKSIQVQKDLPNASKDVLEAINKQMDELTDKIPAFQFLTALPHLSSHMCHPNDAVFYRLKEIFSVLLRRHPQQTLWMISALAESSYKFRITRHKEVVAAAQLAADKTPKPLSPLATEFRTLTKLLLDVCKKPLAADVNSFSMSEFRCSVKRWNIIIPTSDAMVVTLPGSGTPLAGYDPFPADLPTIVSFDDKVQVLSSLQRPRKILIIGSDGRQVPFLCKPDDDLRKDNRIMDFNSIINKLLKGDAAARERQLRIRTYGVIPLNEACGIIEWVQNTMGFRNIVTDIYKSHGQYARVSEIRAICNPRTYATTNGKTLSQKEIFLQKVLPRFPPVFSEWFFTNFPEPSRWYAARLAYARTTAVMSIVGFILGLGDRHGENILFDAKTGEAQHVDFNCLFDKGLSFGVPERVPFRLTHNMVDALGFTGVEGVFRRTCEVTLHVLRQEQDSLINVLETLVYDPLLEWSKSTKQHKSRKIRNELGVEKIEVVKSKLRGLSNSNRGLALSIEGQVHKLIEEATDPNNLCQMYIGWAPYL
eukprot:m.239200 g.239200  ORF g.239200 m.239200 type:complete len:1001 (-) comp17118_c1_seq9:1951-4953(-)